MRHRSYETIRGMLRLKLSPLLSPRQKESGWALLFRRCSSPTKAPNTYSHVELSLATTGTAKASRMAVGSISTILLPQPDLQIMTSQGSMAFWPISRVTSHPHPSRQVTQAHNPNPTAFLFLVFQGESCINFAKAGLKLQSS